MISPLKKFRLRYGETRLSFGNGAVEDLADWIKTAKKVGLVTSKSAAEKSGALKDVLNILSKHGTDYTVFANVSPNPTSSMVLSCAESFRSEKVEAIIAIGGGSVIDVAKAVSLIVRNKLLPEQLLEGVKPPEVLPLVAINLTHGTGSEIDRYAVLTFEERMEKRGFTARYVDLAIDEPKYTLSLPRDQTLYTSLDAFYHAYEAATSKYANSFVLTLAVEASKIIAENLPNLLNNLDSLELRARLLYSSMLAGISIDIAMTHLNHALEHSFSGVNPKLPHGEGLAILGPRVIYHVHKHVPEESALVLRSIDPMIRPISDDAERAYRALREFQSSLGLNKRLSDYGFGKDDIKFIIERTLKMLKERYKGMPLEADEGVIRDIITDAL
ncbi:MAG: iron-containing alcohol dehydrogenase [Thermosphaera sp.]